MDDGDHGVPTAAIHSDPRFLVATTLVTLVVAGSTYIWRSNPRRLLARSDHRGEESYNSEHMSVADAGSSATLVVNGDPNNQANGKDPKSSRSKERRRRGKDPLKELLKTGKKSKVLSKSIKLAEVDGNGVGPSNMLPAIQEFTRLRHSRERSLTTSSRSVSTTSTSNRRTPPPNSDWAGPPSPTPNQSISESDDVGGAGDFSTPDVSNSLPTISQNQTVPGSHPSDHSLQPNPLTHPRSPDRSNLCLSTSSSTSHSSSMFSDLNVTPNTSPTLSLSDKTPTLQAESPLHASANAITTSTTMPSVQKDAGPRAWDAVPSSSTSDSTLRKPPRFRSKSRGSGPLSVSTTTPSSNNTTTSDSEATSLPSFGSARPHDDASHPVTFPTLNPLSNSSNRTVNHVTSNGNITGVSSKANGHPNGSASKHPSTPRRPPTPSGPNMPGSVSAQTQLASLRGALEAARLREEKTKAEIEKYSKELEMMRWESATWRRREMELQNQIHHLMHQMQTYASLVTSMSAQTSPVAQHHRSNNNNNTNGVEPHSPTNGYQFSPSPSPHSPPPHVQIPPMFLANGVLSPMSMGHSPHSPFYPYSPHSPHPHQQLPHLHAQVQQTQSPHQRSNLISMLFPPGASALGSGPSSIAGSSSAGSPSPDMAGSPTPSPTLPDRGRRRTRTRTQTAGARIGERGGPREDGGEGRDGWIGVGDDDAADLPYERTEGEDSDGDEGSVSEVLADAILKRPGSIRGLSSKKGKSKEKEPFIEHTEFTFPSLSELGNVNRGYSRSIETPHSDGEEVEYAKGVNEVAETTIETNQLADAEVEVEESHDDAH